MVLKTIKAILIILFIIVITDSCYYDNDEYLYKYENMVTCDLSNVTYSGTIAPIITANCNACHSSTTDGISGVELDNYTDLKNNINKAWGDINHFAGYNAMPQGTNMLPHCDISQIQVWMNTGTPND